MKRILSVAAALFMALGTQTTARAERPVTEGAKVGEWTMDFDAAKKLAKEKNLPLFLNFTGSDWCGWCKLMDKSVFSTEAWKTYATQHVVTVFIDFPKDKTLVPEKFVKRNQELGKQYKVRGYPTYILLASDGEKQLGKLGASRPATPENFILEMRMLLDWPQKIANLSPEDKAVYDKAKADIEGVEKELKAWIQSKPKQNEESDKKFAEYIKRINDYKRVITLLMEKQK